MEGELAVTDCVRLSWGCTPHGGGPTQDTHTFPSPSSQRKPAGTRSTFSWWEKRLDGMWGHLWEFSFTSFTSEKTNYWKMQRECATCLFVRRCFTVLVEPEGQKCWCVLPFKIAQTDSGAAVTSGPLNALPLASLLAMFLSSDCVPQRKSVHIFFF